MLDEISDPTVMREGRAREEKLPLNQALKKMQLVSSQEQQYNE